MPRYIFDPCCEEHAHLDLDVDADLTKRYAEALRVCEMRDLEDRQRYMWEIQQKYPERYDLLRQMVEHVWARKREVPGGF